MFYIFATAVGMEAVLDISQLSPTQVGNKAYRLGQLSIEYQNIPNFMIVPVQAYEAQIDRLGLGKQNGQRPGDDSPADITPDFVTIQEQIRESRLDSTLMTAVAQFLQQSQTSVAVRSSATYEDKTDDSAAGRYSTILNCRTIDEVEQAILACWVSLWTAEEFATHGMAPHGIEPKMAVVIMEMIDAVASGVLFTADPVYGEHQIVIEAIWGLSQGLVSGNLTPDRIVYDIRSDQILTEVVDKPVLYRMSEDTTGTIAVEVPANKRMASSLSDEQTRSLVVIAQAIESLCHSAQDIEWAVDPSGNIWILQSRDITTPRIPLPRFVPPGSGRWQVIDHIARPGTRCFADYYYTSMETGWNEEAAQIGTLNRVKIREVNGFMYYQMDMVGSEEDFSTMCTINDGYWQEKRYQQRLHQWDEEVKPAAVSQLKDLQETRLKSLSDRQLIVHLDRCLRVTRDMVKNHHSFTYTSFIPVGDFVNQVCEWTGKEPVDILWLLRGGAPHRLFLELDGTPEISSLLEQLQQSSTAQFLLGKIEREPENAAQIIDELSGLDVQIAHGFQAVIDRFGYRITNGYDICAETYIERPDLLLRSVRSVVKHYAHKDETGHTTDLDTVREMVPDDQKTNFDAMLHDAREMERLRDERGMYTDLWAIGILRHAYLEAGERLVIRGVLRRREIVLDATCHELVCLLGGDLVISSQELEKRFQYRTLYDVTDAPAVLGAPKDKLPNLSTLPPDISRTMTGLMTSVELAVEHVRRDFGDANTLAGTPASRGIVEGTARVIHADNQIKDLRRGEIIIAHQTTAAFNAVFPMINGIVTEYGGILSHPAILAREYRIPCLVGCTGAMTHIHTGMRIRLDGNRGTVRILAGGTDTTRRLESLLCDYDGPMRGRNRNRVFSHVDAVSSRLAVVDLLRHEQGCLDTLSMHFHGELSTDDAVEKITSSPISITKELLASFVRRDHIEFHPCDACNLQCSGCTYFQDLPSRPAAVSFPHHLIAKICTLIEPKAVTIVGGGEPSLYSSQGRHLGDILYALGSGEYGCSPEIGLITNGTRWPLGHPDWHHFVKWVRISLDASSRESYVTVKGKDRFDLVVANLIRVLVETAIPQVGVGFLCHSGNVAEAGAVISHLAALVRKKCPEQIHRVNVQFRPWRMPTGRPSINEQVLSAADVDEAAANLFRCLDADPSLEQFVRENTNIAVNLLSRGAREQIEPFEECYYGLAKSVIRADGSIYPCFRMAASDDQRFNCGNIATDNPMTIALKELYVEIFPVRQFCVPEHEKCLLCVFNNMLEGALTIPRPTATASTPSYFF